MRIASVPRHVRPGRAPRAKPVVLKLLLCVLREARLCHWSRWSSRNVRGTGRRTDVSERMDACKGACLERRSFRPYCRQHDLQRETPSNQRHLRPITPRLHHDYQARGGTAPLDRRAAPPLHASERHHGSALLLTPPVPRASAIAQTFTNWQLRRTPSGGSYSR